jgi:hypothetical protein
MPSPLDIVLDKDVPVTMRDGVTACVDVLRPVDDEKVPVIVAWSPYGKGEGSAPAATGVFALVGLDNGIVSGLHKFEGRRPRNAYSCRNPTAASRRVINNQITVPRTQACICAKRLGWNSGRDSITAHEPVEGGLAMAPLLEQDIESLQALDDQRQRCRSLLKSAAQAIIVCVGSALPPSKDDSVSDDVGHAMALRSLGLIARDSTLKLKDAERDSIVTAQEKFRDLLLTSTAVTSLYEEKDPLSSENLDHIPAFRACLVAQALIEDDSPRSALSGASVDCLYRLMTEIYRVDAPKWMAGGVRASRRAPQSAFVTREAVRSILLIHKLLQNTTELLKELSDAKTAHSTAECAPADWKTLISDLRRTDFKTSLEARWPHLLDSSMELPHTEDWAEQVSVHAFEYLRDQFKSFSTRVSELAKPEGDIVSDEVHRTVKEERLNQIVGAAKKQLRLTEDEFNRSSDQLEVKPDDLEAVGPALEKAAAAVLRIIEPCRSFLETVLITELSTDPDRASVDPDAAEAAFAAAALAHIDDASESLDPDDLRLRAATKLASGRLSERSGLPTGAPFNFAGKGYRLAPQSAEAIRAICEMYRYSTCDCEPDTARRLVRYFLETRADRPGADRGWSSDNRPKEGKAEIWATALTYLALRDLLAMLDQQINQHILGHFTVRRPEDLPLELNELFLPDAVAARKNFDGSIGAQLLAMRAHIEGAKSAGGNFFSVVLYGPPGTGKTTLIEALARSSASALVEVTPSDILIGGGAQVERHTRLVFSALSMLTHCVIIFDEFDSILRKRSGDKGTPLNEFQFLTPGLLPKLKLLHDRAAKQQVAYALATNFVGDLDRAAVRSGRFDRRLGIFPPDLLSRVGRLTGEMQKFRPSPLAIKQADNAIDVINSAAGYGMATLGKPGWFTKPQAHTRLEQTPFGYIFDGKARPDFGVPEGQLGEEPDEEARTEDPFGSQEWDEWTAINTLDARGADIDPTHWGSYVKQVETLIKESN